MKRGSYRQTIPNPPGGQIDSVLIRENLNQTGISFETIYNLECSSDFLHLRLPGGQDGLSDVARPPWLTSLQEDMG